MSRFTCFNFFVLTSNFNVSPDIPFLMPLKKILAVTFNPQIFQQDKAERSIFLEVGTMSSNPRASDPQTSVPFIIE